MKRPRWHLVCLALLTLAACRQSVRVMDQPPAAQADGPWGVAADTVLAENAVGPGWIGWTSPCLPDADLVYVDRQHWEIRVMDRNGGHQRCLTCKDENVLGVNFPPDEDDLPPKIHWKGDPEAHPTQAVVFFKAENENSEHKALRNAPSIGWDNDLWALNLCTQAYTRLTHLARGEGLQHTALSEDGAWYVYPRRYAFGRPPWNFGSAAMVFCRLTVDEGGTARLDPQFEIKPLGDMYYEPNSIARNGDGTYTLYYVAGPGTRMDPFAYTWNPKQGQASGDNRALAQTPDLHEEFLMVSPSGKYLAFMQGTQPGLGYHADLYVSDRDFRHPVRVTWYNDCAHWPRRCRRHGAQLSRLTWSADGRSVFYGLWVHGGPLRPFANTELHRLDFTTGDR